ncbi:MAG: hypothetical protein ACOC7S_00615 [Planctomycetota bacterium]
MEEKEISARSVTTAEQRTAERKRPAEYVRAECPIGKREAAEILGISVDTLDTWTARYGIPHFKYDMDRNRGNRGKVVYLISDLLEFRKQYRVEGRDVEAEVDEMIATARRP